MAMQPQMLRSRIDLLFAKIKRLVLRNGGENGIRYVSIHWCLCKEFSVVHVGVGNKAGVMHCITEDVWTHQGACTTRTF